MKRTGGWDCAALWCLQRELLRASEDERAGGREGGRERGLVRAEQEWGMCKSSIQEVGSCSLLVGGASEARLHSALLRWLGNGSKVSAYSHQPPDLITMATSDPQVATPIALPLFFFFFFLFFTSPPPPHPHPPPLPMLSFSLHFSPCQKEMQQPIRLDSVTDHHQSVSR